MIWTLFPPGFWSSVCLNCYLSSHISLTCVSPPVLYLMNLSWLLLLHCWKVLLDTEVLKNFRPVSNLTYLSKIIERVVVVRLNQHLTKNGLHVVLQSAYKQTHSTETAIPKIQNYLLMAIDKYGGAVLILLDLSAVFDTIDHTILLQRLHEFGIRDAALDWFRSYLDQRRQSVVINGMAHYHHIEICLSECLTDQYLAQYY